MTLQAPTLSVYYVAAQIYAKHNSGLLSLVWLLYIDSYPGVQEEVVFCGVVVLVYALRFIKRHLLH